MTSPPLAMRSASASPFPFTPPGSIFHDFRQRRHYFSPLLFFVLASWARMSDCSDDSISTGFAAKLRRITRMPCFSFHDDDITARFRDALTLAIYANILRPAFFIKYAILVYSRASFIRDIISFPGGLMSVLYISSHAAYLGIYYDGVCRFYSLFIMMLFDALKMA